MKLLNNNHRFVFLLILTFQIMSCAYVTPDGETASNVIGPGSNLDSTNESTVWFPLKQTGDGIYRITVGSGKNRTLIGITDNKFYMTDENGKNLKGCVRCTKKLQQEFNLDKNCNGAEKVLNIKICKKHGLYQCPNNECVFEIGGVDVCRACR